MKNYLYIWFPETYLKLEKRLKRNAPTMIEHLNLENELFNYKTSLYKSMARNFKLEQDLKILQKKYDNLKGQGK